MYSDVENVFAKLQTFPICFGLSTPRYVSKGGSGGGHPGYQKMAGSQTQSWLAKMCVPM